MRKIGAKEEAYDLDEIKALVSRGSYLITKRVRNFLLNHGYDPNYIINGVFSSARSSDFYKSVELEIEPGEFGDIYYVEFDNETWYLKFYKLDNCKEVYVRVLSCNLDGYRH